MLDMSWDQIYLAAESIALHKTEMMNMLLQPVIGTLGGKWNGGKVGNRHSKRKNSKKATPAQKEQNLMHSFAAAGFPVSVK